MEPIFNNSEILGKTGFSVVDGFIVISREEFNLIQNTINS
jgi:hypothetical protein